MCFLGALLALLLPCLYHLIMTMSPPRTPFVATQGPVEDPPTASDPAVSVAVDAYAAKDAHADEVHGPEGVELLGVVDAPLSPPRAAATDAFHAPRSSV